MKLADTLESELKSFINEPYTLWETSLTTQLVHSKYESLALTGIADRLAYNTVSALNFQTSLPNKQFLVSHHGNAIYMEKPDKENLDGFYQEHGLLALSERALINDKAASKIKAAIDLLSLVPECVECVSALVNCIQVIKSEGPEYDTSYSHPDIPFTVFISICQDSSILSSLRVAENILHEAMHLKLSLIQEHVQLIKPDCQDTFYSPWRDTHRPLVGVLHGLFVFRAILDFYSFISLSCGNGLQLEFLQDRVTMIKEELRTLAHFGSAKGLTKLGGNFATRLLQY